MKTIVSVISVNAGLEFDEGDSIMADRGFTMADCLPIDRAGARTLIGGGGCIFIYSGYPRLISFEINFITKETSRQNLNI